MGHTDIWDSHNNTHGKGGRQWCAPGVFEACFAVQDRLSCLVSAQLGFVLLSWASDTAQKCGSAGLEVHKNTVHAAHFKSAHAVLRSWKAVCEAFSVPGILFSEYSNACSACPADARDALCNRAAVSAPTTGA